MRTPLRTILVTLMLALPIQWMPRAAIADETYKIAFIGPLTGPTAAVGIGMRNSVELRLRQANERNEIPGVKLQLVALDDASDPSQGVAAVEKIGPDRTVLVSIGHWNSPVALATAPIFVKYGLLNVTPGAANWRITEQGNAEIGRVTARDKVQAKQTAEFIVNKLNAKRLVAISDKTAFGNSVTSAVLENISKLGGTKVVAEDGITVGEKNFFTLLTRLRGLNPDVIYFGGLATEGGLIRRQMKEVGLKAEFVGAGAIQNAAFVEVAGPEAANGSITIGMGQPVYTLPGGQEFVEAYKKAGYAAPFESYGPYAYTAAEVAVHLIKTEGANRQAIVRGLRKIKDLETIYGTVSFDENGQMQPEVTTPWVVKDGKWTPIVK